MSRDEQVRNHIFSCLECETPDDLFGCLEGLEDGNDAEFSNAEIEDEG